MPRVNHSVPCKQWRNACALKPTSGAEHPGTMLRAILNEVGMSQRELADVIARPTQSLNEMINGKNAISSHTALQLASALGVPAEVWVIAQALHDLHLARSGRPQTGHHR